jgi:hypothetical protein
VVLVDDFIWSIFSEEVSEGMLKPSPDPLTFSGLRMASLDDFGMIIYEIFSLFDVVESQGKRNVFSNIRALFIYLFEGVLRLVRNSKQRMTEVINLINTFRISLTSAVNSIIGLRSFGSGSRDAEDFR